MPLDVPEVNPQVPVVPIQNSTFNDIILNIIQLIPVMGPIVIDKVFSSTEEDLLYRLLKTLEAYLTGNSGITLVNNANHVIADADSTILFHSLTADRNITLPAAADYLGRKLVIKNSTNNGGGWVVNTSTNFYFDSNIFSSTIGPGETISLISDGVTWWIIDN